MTGEGTRAGYGASAGLGMPRRDPRMQSRRVRDARRRGEGGVSVRDDGPRMSRGGADGLARDRCLARLEAGNQPSRLAARPLGHPYPVAADGDAPRFRPGAGLHHVDLRARGMHAHPEAGEVEASKSV